LASSSFMRAPSSVAGSSWYLLSCRCTPSSRCCSCCI
jgi:hypothetical protein